MIDFTSVAATTGPSLAGSWVKTYPSCGSCEGNAITTTADGGYLVVGVSHGWGDQRSSLMLKTDAAGMEQWAIKGAGDSCAGLEAVANGSGPLAAAGSSCESGSGAAIVMETEVTKGTVLHLWDYDSGTDARGRALIRTDDGGYLLLEDVADTTAERTDRRIIVRRLTAGGDSLWDRSYYGMLNDTAVSAIETEDGGYAIAGTTMQEGKKDTDILLIRFGPDGSGNDVQIFGDQERDESASSIVQTGDGGFFLSGTSCKAGSDSDCDMYAIRTDAAGAVLWEQRYGGSGRDRTAAAVADPDGGYVLVGSTDSAELGAIDRDICIIGIDDNGAQLWNSTFGSEDYEWVTGAMLAPDGALVITGYTTKPVDTGTHTLFLIHADRAGRNVPESLARTNSVSSNEQQGIVLKVRDAKAGTGIAGAQVYYDGKLAGTTSDTEGTFVLRNANGGTHSFRITKTGYRETTTLFSGDRDSTVTVYLHPSAIHRISGAGSTDQALDVVFVPSNTTYDCTLGQKVPSDQYTRNSETFLADVRRLSTEKVFAIDQYSTDASQIPAGFQQRFNLYYYWDGNRFADAFSGCAGSLPDGFYDEAPFTDVAIILYPTYGGTDPSDTCEPSACTSAPGPGPQVYFKVPADRGMVFLHESGHAMFGLMDTYDGPTYYAENQPFPNIWGNEENCSQYAEQNGWEISLCRPIGEVKVRTETGNNSGFFRYDPDPDIMGGTGPSAKFGKAATRRIRYVFDAVQEGTR